MISCGVFGIPPFNKSLSVAPVAIAPHATSLVRVSPLLVKALMVIGVETFVDDDEVKIWV
jgi:hypothetical protein